MVNHALSFSSNYIKPKIATVMKKVMTLFMDVPIITLCAFDEDPRSLQMAAADVPSADSMAGSMMSSAAVN